MKKHSILVAIDFSDSSEIVLKKALKLSINKGWDIYVTHIIERGFFGIETDFDTAKKNCISFLEQKFPQIKHSHFYCIEGDIKAEILKLAENLAVNLIVLGSSGESFSLEKLLLGSTTKKIIRESSVPVLVVKNEDEPLYRNIVIPTDFTDASKKVVENTANLFPESLLKLLHLYSVPFEGRLNIYGFDKSSALDFSRQIGIEQEFQCKEFVKHLHVNKDKIQSIVKKGILNVKYFGDDGWLFDSDLVVLHTTGSLSFFAFDLLESSTKDVIIYKM